MIDSDVIYFNFFQLLITKCVCNMTEKTDKTNCEFFSLIFLLNLLHPVFFFDYFKQIIMQKFLFHQYNKRLSHVIVSRFPG